MKLSGKSFIFFLILLCLLGGCNKKSQAEIQLEQKEIVVRKNASLVHGYALNLKKQKEEAYKNFIQNTPLEEKICQLFIVNLDGNQVFRPVEDLSLSSKKDRKIVPGGFLFFGFNLSDTPEKIMSFTNSIDEYCKKNDYILPFLAIDHEGGAVNRLKKINASLPSCKDVSESLSEEEAYKLYELQAIQLYELGFTMNLAPVTEAVTDDNKAFLGDRSFGDEEAVINYSRACIKAYQDNKVAAVIKHFPGNTNTDPHTGLPVIRADEEGIQKLIKPFRELVKENPAGILMSHAIVDLIDKGVPSCLSYKWVTEILRNELSYNGIIFSDDIFMGALVKNGYPADKAVVLAVEAGIDCIMVSEKRIQGSVKVLFDKAQNDPSFKNRIEQSFKRMTDYKLDNGILEYKKMDDGSFVIVSSTRSHDVETSYKVFSDAKKENEEFNKSFF